MKRLQECREANRQKESIDSSIARNQGLDLFTNINILYPVIIMGILNYFQSNIAEDVRKGEIASSRLSK